jgi:arginyl-tRNA synthetase
MKNIEITVKESILQCIQNLYQLDWMISQINIENTSSDYKGDYTYVVFPLLKFSKKGPEQTANEIAEVLKLETELFSDIQVVKGFINFSINANYWLNFVAENAFNPLFGYAPLGTKENVLVEYSSPNTNKPLHLGHIRNNLLGYSVIQILKANGYHVKSCNLINDRGIHICKSMYAWLSQGNGETPESAQMKGDHLVGKYYVAFEKQHKIEKEALIQNGMDEETAAKQTASMLAAQELLRKWEAGDEEVIAVWEKMNAWVYEGFHQTYKQLGVDFDQYYYESDTYLLGKKLVEEGLATGAFFKKENGSVWVDLEADGLDQKLLLRADGTSVYITQDMGTAELKYEDFKYTKSIYVVGNEQDYHFKVLQLILSKMNKPYANGIYHLSYGMVELPEGKMKSREGTVVDADDLMQEMFDNAKQITTDLGKTESLTLDEQTHLFQTIGLGALKYYLLKVDPKKKMMFNPKESIDFQGNTGPFIQYTHARIKSVLRNSTDQTFTYSLDQVNLSEFEKNMVVVLHQFPSILQDAAKDLSPGIICNYCFELAKSFNQFYHEHSILKEANEQQRKFRLVLCSFTAQTLLNAGNMLGIQMPERM